MDKQRVMKTLRDAMDRTGVKAAHIAKACDISPQAVSNWWKTGTVSRQNLSIAARMVGLTLDELLENPPPMRPPAVDNKLLIEAIEEVETAVKARGRGRDISAEQLAALITETYNSLVIAEQAKLAVSEKLAKMWDLAKSGGGSK